MESLVEGFHKIQALYIGFCNLYIVKYILFYSKKCHGKNTILWAYVSDLSHHVDVCHMLTNITDNHSPETNLLWTRRNWTEQLQPSHDSCATYQCMSANSSEESQG